jgi:hypothetical protein
VDPIPGVEVICFFSLILAAHSWRRRRPEPFFAVFQIEYRQIEYRRSENGSNGVRVYSTNRYQHNR